MIQIRDYKPSDYQSLKVILEENKMYDPDLDAENTLQRKIETSPGSILVAEDNSQVVGGVYILFDHWQSFIFRLSVRKDSQRQGIGAKLMEEAESRLRRQGAKSVALWVRLEELSHLARHYENLGYKPSPREHKCFWKAL